ncbi:uncharacterized protein LOC109543091 isoform X1 [Dendroctonus ponderosae]|uniref:uncharacterized protein LOC109543091 isoform X1 n=1 Tax=Dendroctonus ponderosae TaxID=77166 RepID=UPI0020365D0B|nr:uncharacterized protein LOC109543091 isoform X1 [Dendroctonus ponderosae]
MNRQSFYFGSDVGVFLIKGIDVKSTGGLVAICVFVGCFSFFFEYLRYLQTKSKQKELKLRAKQIKQLCPTESATLLAGTITNPRNPFNITLFDRALLFGTEVSLWLFLQTLGYVIMLSVMLYDAWILISAVIGGGIGYFVFGQKFMKINLENCHIIRETYCTQICGETDVGGYNGEPSQSTPPLESPSESQEELQRKCHGDGMTYHEPTHFTHLRVRDLHNINTPTHKCFTRYIYENKSSLIQ